MKARPEGRSLSKGDVNSGAFTPAVILLPDLLSGWGSERTAIHSLRRAAALSIA